MKPIEEMNYEELQDEVSFLRSAILQHKKSNLDEKDSLLYSVLDDIKEFGLLDSLKWIICILNGHDDEKLVCDYCNHYIPVDHRFTNRKGVQILWRFFTMVDLFLNYE